MKRLLLVLAGVALASAPLAARPTPFRNADVWSDIVQLEADVDRADRNDTISEREAAGIRSQIAKIKSDYQRMNNRGLTPGEYNSLESRISKLRQRLNRERHDRDHHRG